MKTRFESLDVARYALPQGFSSRLASPALVVYLDHVRENLRRVLARCGGDPGRWRPHVKTAKIPAVFAEIVRAGVRGFKCATTREAGELGRTLAGEGLIGGDVLVAFPLVGPALDRLGALARAWPETRFSVLCEEPDAVEQVPPEVDIFVDVDAGMRRTGVPLEDRSRILAVARRAATRFRGVHCYEGHLREHDLESRRRGILDCYERLADLVEHLDAARVHVAEVVTGGTPSFLDALAFRRLVDRPATAHRLSPGTVIYHDLRSEQENPGLDLLPAALVFTRVVSRPSTSTVTCDAGSKSLAAEGSDPCAWVLGHPGLEPERPSEEHLPLHVSRGAAPGRGDELLLVPWHVCPTVNLAEEALLVEAGAVPRVVRVSARAHDLLLEL